MNPMKKFTSLLFTLFFSLAGFFTSHAQITADSVPSGMYAVNPYISLSVSPCGSFDSSYVDLNCDQVPDMTLILYKSYTMIDGSNMLYLRILDHAYEICKDTAGMFSSFYGRPHYYNAGDPLVCPVNAEWANDSIYEFGDYGCMDCTGPNSENNVYIAYRKLGQVRWMKVSFYLSDLGSCTFTITASINLILSPCMSSGIQSSSDPSAFYVSPNPFSSQTIINTNRPLHDGTLTVYNAFGQVVKQMNNLEGQTITFQRDNLPEGVYFIRLEDDDIISVNKIVIADK
jgi:hypothetical protein